MNPRSRFDYLQVSNFAQFDTLRINQCLVSKGPGVDKGIKHRPLLPKNTQPYTSTEIALGALVVPAPLWQL